MAQEGTNLPSSEKPGGVFVLGTSQLMDAPKEKVWQILKDFPSYKEWYNTNYHLSGK